MRIGIDLRFTSASQMGTGTYAETAALALAAARQAGDEIIGFVDAPVSDLLASTFKLVRIPRQVGGRCFLDAQRVVFDSAIARERLDVFWSPAGIAPLMCDAAVAVTIHDLWFEREPAHYNPDLLTYLRREVRRSMAEADAIIAISSATAGDVMAECASARDRTRVITQELRAAFHQRPDDATARSTVSAADIDYPYVLALTNFAPHKNTMFALEVFAGWLRASGDSLHRLIIAGGGPAPQAPQDLAGKARTLGISDRVVFAGRVSDEALPSLMARAAAFLQPSLHEGWGLPPLEALAMGTPAIVSDRGGLPEAVGSAAVVLPLERPSAWIEALAELVGNGASAELAAAMKERADQLKKPTGPALRAALADAITLRAGFVADAIVPGTLPTLAPGKLAAPIAPATERTATGISACTILRNGVALDYPFLESVASYAPICDEIVVCWDPTSTDATRDLVELCSRTFPHVRLVESAWDMANRDGGSELARQTQIAFTSCRTPWTLYIQADEALHECDHELLRGLARDSRVEGIAFERRSFLETLEKEIPAHRVTGLVRMFRTGLGESVGDAMAVKVTCGSGSIVPTSARLFNYSRLGSREAIAKRTANLHHFYHDDGAASALAERADQQIAEDFTGTHPAPIEKRFRPALAIPDLHRPPGRPSISVNIIAREEDGFGRAMFHSCLEALTGYADHVVVVDNGLDEEALEMVRGMRSRLPLEIQDGRHHRSFADLRNQALTATPPGIDYIHKIDTDEVYLPQSLNALRELLSQDRPEQASASLVHFMIDPTLVESVQDKEVIFRHRPELTWSGAVHERPANLVASVARSPGVFLHFGYCRPQWQIFLKWLTYAHLQTDDVRAYQEEWVDGVRVPWFRGTRTPDTILEPRRAHLQRYSDPYPEVMRPWLDDFARSHKPWRDWLTGCTDHQRWEEWQALASRLGSWEATLWHMLRLKPKVAASA